MNQTLLSTTDCAADSGALLSPANMFAEYPDIMTIDQVQSSLGISKNIAYKLMKSGDVRHFHIGKLIKVPKKSLIDYIMNACYNNNSVVCDVLPGLREGE
jgi:hypothetical protein